MQTFHTRVAPLLDTLCLKLPLDALPHPLISSLLNQEIKKENLSDKLKEMIKQEGRKGSNA